MAEGIARRIEETLAKFEELIFQLRNLEKEIIDSEERFRLVAEFAYDWEYWHDATGNFIYTSPSVESMTGYTPADFLANKHLINTLIHPEDREKWLTHSHAKLENNEVAPIEFRVVTKSGETRWIHHVCRTVFAGDGRNRGVRGSNRDITERKKLQAEIKILKGLLQICSSCKKIRDDQGNWTQMELYIKNHSEAEFSHGLCPECARKLYPDLKIFK